MSSSPAAPRPNPKKVQPTEPAPRCCRTCAKTPNTSDQINVCASCRRATYCSRSCQRKDWKARHGTECPKWTAERAAAQAAEAGRPMGRLVKPWEVANMIVFLLSAESGMTTGNSIDIDQSISGAGDPPIPRADERLDVAD